MLLKVLDKLAAGIAPHQCVVCAQEGNLLHKDCADQLPTYLPKCFVCGAANNDYQTCKSCVRSIGCDAVYVRSALVGPAKQLIGAYKFSEKYAAHSSLAIQISSCLPAVMPDFVVVAVPTIGQHVRSRGFDHAELLAQEVADVNSLPYRACLDKTGKVAQVGSDRSTRLTQLAGTIVCSSRSVPRKVLLIDDVATTGATLRECAKALRRAGTEHVYAAVFAKTL